MTNTHQYYIQRIDMALSFIAESLSQSDIPSLEDIAEAACLSKFHFHRIYRLVTGETCQQTIERIRLAIAADTLAAEKGSVTMAAMNANYSSSQALAKALKRVTGTTASELRRDPEQLSATIEQLQLPADNSLGLVAVELTHLSPVQYISRLTDLPYEQLNTIYEQLFMDAGGPENVMAIIGQSIGNMSALTGEKALFECGLVLRSFDGKQTELRSQGDYLRMRHTGSFNNLDDSIDNLYRFLLMQESVTFDNQGVFFHYLDDPEEVAETRLRTDIYVPVCLN